MRTIFTCMVTLILGTGLAWGKMQTSKITPELLKLVDTKMSTDILVDLNERPDLSEAAKIENREERLRYVYDKLRHAAKKSQKDILKLIKKRGFEHRSFYIQNTILVKEADYKIIDELSQRQEVISININAKAQFYRPITDMRELERQAQGKMRNPLAVIKVDKVWSELGVRGENIVVAGQDTGYLWDHKSIKKQYRGYKKGSVDHNYNWHDAIHDSQGKCGSSASAPCDDNAHGTHTMGTIVGDGGENNKIGVAPDAKWIGCRNMNAGYGTPATYLECFEFFLAPYAKGGNPQEDGKPELAPHIINNSWGCPRSEGCQGGEFIEAIRAMKAAGIMVVVSAGNEGSRCQTVGSPPGTYSGDVVSVGAYNRYQDKIAYFSSRGPSAWNGGLAPTITAPGSGIRSATNRSKDSYTSMSGTSMAGPHIAGVIALMWSAQPKLVGDIEKTEEILYSTATPKRTSQNCGDFPGDKVPNAVYGHGMVDAYAAVKKAKSL